MCQCLTRCAVKTSTKINMHLYSTRNSRSLYKIYSSLEDVYSSVCFASISVFPVKKSIGFSSVDYKSETRIKNARDFGRPGTEEF